MAVGDEQKRMLTATLRGGACMLLVVGAMGSVVNGCALARAAATEAQAGARPDALTISNEAPLPAPNDSVQTTEMQSTIDAALDAAAKRTGLDRSMLVVLSAEAVTWPDGALGCPKPGRMYTQALVPGYRIRIQAGNQILEYHANARKYLVLCAADGRINPRPDPRN
jgi:hypothetical protein